MRFLFLYLFLILEINANDATLSSRPGMANDVCSGTNNLLARWGSGDILEDLENMYRGCRRVLGNLEITWIEAPEIRKWRQVINQTVYADVDYLETVNFFDHIEEIRGSLIIYRANIQTISFPKLRVIYGDEVFHDQALYIHQNEKVNELVMNELRVIRNGSVTIQNNPRMCFLGTKVDWNEILHDSSKQTVETWNSHKACWNNEDPIASCHESCTKDKCWGNGDNDCQKMYRSVCPKCCSQCFFSNITQSYECCDSTCLGGCTDHGPDNCIACSKYKMDDEICVDTCPPRKIYNDKRGSLVSNPDGRYQNGNRCVKECPPNLLVENDVCVRHCSEGYNTTEDTRECEKCRGSGCTKDCIVEGPLTSRILKTLEGCERIDGHLRIGTTFKYEELKVLESVKIVTEYIEIVKQDFWDLKFLKNLQIIEGRKLLNMKWALAIYQCNNLVELNLNSLKLIKTGSVIINENHRLCYVGTVDWESIIQSKGDQGKAKLRAEGNSDSKLCIREEKICDPNCNSRGCWGKQPEDCLECRTWNNMGTCVSSQCDIGFFGNQTSMTCEKCSPECETCNGLGEFDCLSCRHYTFYNPDFGNRMECVTDCPTHTRCYTIGNVCEKCYENGLHTTSEGDSNSSHASNNST